MGELQVLPPDLARRLAPIAGFGNILIHEYLAVDWDEVYDNLQDLDDLHQFVYHVEEWMESRAGS